jgi:hypothetical protein
MLGLLEICGRKRICVDYFMVLFQNLLGDTEQSHENALRITGLCTVFETETFEYEAVLRYADKNLMGSSWPD